LVSLLQDNKTTDKNVRPTEKTKTLTQIGTRGRESALAQSLHDRFRYALVREECRVHAASKFAKSRA
jgi:hypothetical protein